MQEVHPCTMSVTALTNALTNTSFNLSSLPHLKTVERLLDQSLAVLFLIQKMLKMWVINMFIKTIIYKVIVTTLVLRQNQERHP